MRRNQILSYTLAIRKEMYLIKIIFKRSLLLQNKDKYVVRSIKSFLGGTYNYNYVNSNNSNPSLPCPAEGFKCGLFSKCFNKYDEEIKKKLLINTDDDKLPSHEVS